MQKEHSIYRIKWFAFGLLGAAALASCPGSVLAQETLKIGVPTALTGTYAGLGAEAVRAIEFAVEEANAKGGVAGHKVEIKTLDTEAKPEVARKQAEKLALEGYKILTGTIASGEGLAMGPLLARWDALYISTINKSDKLTGDSCVPRMFRTNHQDAQDAAVVRPWLGSRKEGKWAILAADIAWGRDSGKSFTDAAKVNKRDIVAEIYSPFGSNDYAPFIQQIKSSGAEGLWVALAGRDAINFATQAKEFGILDKVFVAGVSFVTDNNVKTLGATSKGIWGIINYSSTLDTPENKAFVEAWKKKYNGDDPASFEGETYLGMQVIFQAVAKANSVKSADVARALSGGTFDTILGKVTLRAQDHQMILPNYFGYIGEQGGKLRPIHDEPTRKVTMSLTVKSKVEVPELIAKRRGQIITAAIELFARDGYHVTTIRDIAKRADVSIGTIYQYVSDKEDVLFLTLIEVLDAYQRHVPAAIEGVSEPLARFHAAIRAYCTVNDAKIGATVLAYRETKSLPKARRKLIQEKELATNRLIAACINDCIAAGLFEDLDVELFTYQIVMFAHAWALKAWRFRPMMTLDEYLARGITLMLNPKLTSRGKNAFAKLNV